MAVTTPRKVTDDAATWLARLVDGSGRVGYAMDAVSGRIVRRGAFAHGRAAAVIRALDEQGGHPRHVRASRRWLTAEIEAALAGERVADWPLDSSRVAGTLALAVLAGIDVRDPLELSTHAVTSPWHGAQCVLALGPESRAARRLWRRCTHDLDAHAFAPWTLLAANRMGDDAIAHRCEDVLTGLVRERAPHRGGVDVTDPPEIALTALTIQALSSAHRPAASSACAKARQFLRRIQVRQRGPLLGAFPASPDAAYFRADITAHALLALL